MKLFISLITTISFFQFAHSQIFKGLGDKIKKDAEWRVRNKADQQVNKAVNKVIEVPGKVIDKKKRNKKEKQNTSTENNSNPSSDKSSKSITAATNDDNDMLPKDGQLTLALSTENVFAGGRITISGESVNYKKFNTVEVTVNGAGERDLKLIPLATDGKYIAEWIADDKAGSYTVSVKSSDKKIQQSAKFTVYNLPQLNNWCDENIIATNAAYYNLKNTVAKAENNISAKDKTELNKKMDNVKSKVNDALKLFKDLNTAGKETAALLKSSKNISPNISNNLSALNDNLAEHARQMKSFQKLTDHQPQDNTVCEYMVMVNEACAAFSAFTNFWTTSLKTILINVTLDKGVPKVVDIVNTKGMQIDAPHDFFPKEVAKIFTISKFDAESLSKKLGKAGIAGDVLQYGTEVILKTYCGIFKGEIKHDYTVKFRNAQGIIWWKYGVSMQGALSLRYPKNESSGKIIKMKGNLEGNATKFTFYQNVAVEEGFKDGTKGKVEVIELKTLKPPAFPFVSSLSDVAGFGAVARTIATPACFNITVDAEYDVDAKKIKLFTNSALIDFSPAVVNQFIFLLVGADLLPYIKRMMFPIHKALSTISSIVKDNNEFIMDKDLKGNLSFVGKANKHIGNPSAKIEHDLNFYIAAKKE